MLSSSRQIRLLSTLGEGGFGAVYLVEVSGEDGFVQRAALKVLHASMSAHRDIAGRQRDEARLLGQLNHDHIVRVLDLGTYDGRPAVLMEYVEGVDADRLLELGPLPPRAALELVAAAASALDAASTSLNPRSGRPLAVVHRDIKPANILVTSNGGVKVLDFGVARADIAREGSTQSVQFGTARYMAPETWMDGRVSPAVDIYALGVSLVELLRGDRLERPPLHPQRYEAALDEVIGALPAPERGAWAAGLRELVRQMLAYEEVDRPLAADVRERAFDLAESADGERLARAARRLVPGLLSRPRELPPPPSPASPEGTQFVSGLPLTPTPVGAQPRRSALVPGETTPLPAAASVETTPLPMSPEPSLAVVPALERSEVVASPERSAELAPARSGRAGLWAATLAGVGVVLVGLTWALTRDPAPAPAEPVAEAPVEAPPLAQPPVEQAPVQVDAPDAEAAPAPPVAPPKSQGGNSGHGSTSSLALTPPPAASSAIASEPVEASAAAPIRCERSDDRVQIDVSSDPMGAVVALGGHALGTTPLRGCGLPAGNYTLALSLGAAHAQHAVRVSRRSPSRYMWRSANDGWEVE